MFTLAQKASVSATKQPTSISLNRLGIVLNQHCSHERGSPYHELAVLMITRLNSVKQIL